MARSMLTKFFTNTLNVFLPNSLTVTPGKKLRWRWSNCEKSPYKPKRPYVHIGLSTWETVNLPFNYDFLIPFNLFLLFSVFIIGLFFFFLVLHQVTVSQELSFVNQLCFFFFCKRQLAWKLELSFDRPYIPALSFYCCLPRRSHTFHSFESCESEYSCSLCHHSDVLGKNLIPYAFRHSRNQDIKTWNLSVPIWPLLHQTQ